MRGLAHLPAGFAPKRDGACDGASACTKMNGSHAIPGMRP